MIAIVIKILKINSPFFCYPGSGHSCKITSRVYGSEASWLSFINSEKLDQKQYHFSQVMPQAML